MTILKGIYKCNVCGNIVEMVHTGAGELVCCGQPMVKMEAKEKDEGMEKHLPVVEKTEFGFKVKVGSVPHPMEEGHFIEWIEISLDGKEYRQFLAPGQAPEAEFDCDTVDITNIQMRAYCNVHGLWGKGN